MKNQPLDEIDRRLLALLRRDARQPMVSLARELGLSRTATQERLKRLERDGVVLGYTAKLRAPDEQSVRAWFSIVLSAGCTCADLTPELLEWPEVRLCHSIAGPIDILVLVQAESLQQLADLREAVAHMRAVQSVSTAAVLASHWERD